MTVSTRHGIDIITRIDNTYSDTPEIGNGIFHLASDHLHNFYIRAKKKSNICLQNDLLDGWIDGWIYKKQTICLQNDLLDDWMTRKKSGYICSKLPVGWLDGWMDRTSQTYV